MFKILDEKKGIFSLHDPIFNRETRWKITSEARPGLVILQKSIDKQIEKVSEIDITKTFESGTDEEKIRVSDEIMKLTEKKMVLLASFVENLDPMPDIYENKIEFLAANLSHKEDPMKINTFFLTYYTDSMKSVEESKKEP